MFGIPRSDTITSSRACRSSTNASKPSVAVRTSIWGPMNYLVYLAFAIMRFLKLRTEFAQLFLNGAIAAYDGRRGSQLLLTGVAVEKVRDRDVLLAAINGAV